MKLRLADSSLSDCPAHSSLSTLHSPSLPFSVVLSLAPTLLLLLLLLLDGPLHTHIGIKFHGFYNGPTVECVLMTDFLCAAPASSSSFHFHSVESHFYSFIVTVSGRTHTHTPHTRTLLFCILTSTYRIYTARQAA